MEKKLSKNQSKDKNALLIIDVQSKIIRPIENHKIIISNIEKLLRAFEILENHVYISEQNPSKLGSTVENLLPKITYKKLSKMEFSVGRNQILQKDIYSKGISNIIICGFETHICIQQSVLDFIEQNKKVYIIADAMSSRNKIDHDISLKRMISKGGNIASTESMIFELCKTANRKEFKEISNLIKNY